MKICPKCNHANDDVSFCCICGHDLRGQSTQKVRCPHCGFSENNGNDTFCSKCGKKLKKAKNKPLSGFAAMGILLIIAVMFCFSSAAQHDIDAQTATDPQIQSSNQLHNDTEQPSIPSTEVTEPLQEETVPKVSINMDCNHIFEVFTGKHGVETSCRFCGISMNDLFDAGIILPDIECEHYYEQIIQTNGTPAYECKHCHNILLFNNPALTDLKLLADTNAEGKTDDIKYGTFYHNGWEWDNAVRFWVADKSGYTNTESMEVYLANAYDELHFITFAARESDDDTNMTLRFYGDGQLLYEMTDITKNAEIKSDEIDITDIEVLKVECSTEKNAFGYCVLQGIVW